MTDTFRFKSNVVSLNLCDRQYELTVDEDTVRICDRIRSDAKEYLKKLKADNTDTDATVSEICGFFKGCIDSLLGEGVAEEVFGTRQMKLFDLTDLLSFILAKIGEFVVERACSGSNVAEETL